jgi:hypothetical protein
MRKIKIRRQGILRFNRMKEKELPFRSGSQYHPTAQSLVATECARTRPISLEALEHPGLVSRDDLLAAQDPLVCLTMAIPAPPILYLERPLSMRLTVSARREMAHRLGALSLRIPWLRLRTTTAVRVGSASQEHVSYQSICHVTGKIPIVLDDEGVFILDSGLWQTHVVPMAPPNFASSALSVTHALEVTASFSSQTARQVQVRWRTGHHPPETC